MDFAPLLDVLKNILEKLGDIEESVAAGFSDLAGPDSDGDFSDDEGGTGGGFKEDSEDEDHLAPIKRPRLQR
jgi:hypothetical protein